MIKKIVLDNFRLHDRTTIDAARFTFFIGPNNSGKSSVFHALLCLKQAGQTNTFWQPLRRQQTNPTNQPYLYPPNAFLDIGGGEFLTRPGKDIIGLELEGEFEKPSATTVSWKLQVNSQTLVDSAGVLSLPFEPGRVEWKTTQTSQRTDPTSFVTDGCTIALSAPKGYRPLSAGITYPPDMPPARRNEIQNRINALTDTPFRLIQSVHMVYPTRGIEEFYYPSAANSPGHLDLVSHADRSVAFADMLLSNSELKSCVSEWLQKLLGVEIDAEKMLDRINVRVRRRKTPFAAEGSGANQLPFTLIPIALAPPGDTVLLTEPEAHLHPKAQYELGELLIRIGLDEGKQLFLESHSEHILHPFLVALARKKLSPQDFALYEFENRDGVSVATRLEVTPEGRIRGGLKGFFQQSLRELSEYLAEPST
ncbi:MAG: AAA family ATPase [Planctomycetes bacterium]|nr:AAA family ATPase [Planctomycetota bacterium]